MASIPTRRGSSTSGPVFAGFGFATSFTPDNTEDTRNTVNGAATRPSNDLGQNSGSLSVATNFTHDFNGVKLIAGGGGTWSFQREQQQMQVADVISAFTDYVELDPKVVDYYDDVRNVGEDADGLFLWSVWYSSTGLHQIVVDDQGSMVAEPAPGSRNGCQ